MSATATGSIKAEVNSSVPEATNSPAPAANNNPVPAATKASIASQRGADLERRRMVIVSTGLFLVLGSGILLAMTTDLPTTLIQRTSLGRPRDMFGIEERNGSIVLPPANNRCRQIAFNNDTGRMVETSRPCESRPQFDEKGIPVPEATIRRLDSIRQSFSK